MWHALILKRKASLALGVVALFGFVQCGGSDDDAGRGREYSEAPSTPTGAGTAPPSTPGAGRSGIGAVNGAAATGGRSSSGGAAGVVVIPGAPVPAPTITPPSGASAGAASQAAAGGASGEDDDDDPTDQGMFEAPGTNPFVMAAHDPLSTFGADVDTASYDIFRRDIDLGALPAPASVRLEEWVNNFAYDYPAPDQDSPHPFDIALAAAPSLEGDGTLVLRVGIQGKNPPPQQKKPTNLVFLVDVSGSMASPNKLPLVQQVLKETIALLEPTDRISIVTYSTEVGVRLPSAPASNRTLIESAVDSLIAEGSTAGGPGLQLAYEQAKATYFEGGVNHILLCTDGDFNVGVSTTEGLLALVTEERKSGVTLTMLGFGDENLNDAMMERVSNAGNGIYGVISNPTQASDYVEKRLLSTFIPIAKDMKIQLEWNPEQVLAFRLLGYENRAIADEDFRDDTVDAGEVGAGHRVTALYQIVPKGGELPAARNAPDPEDGAPYDGEVEVTADDLVLVKVRYKEPGAAEEDAASEVARSLAAEAVESEPGALDADFRWALAVAAFAEIAKKSPYANAARLDAISELVHESVHESYDDRVEFVRLFDRAVELGIGDR